MMNIREVLIPTETCHITKKGNTVYIRTGKIIVPTSLTIHSTGNLKSTAMNERNWLINPTNNSDAGWNICVDEKEAIIAIPLNEKSNHSGNGTGNNTSIGLEICESGDREKTLRNAIQVSAWILKRFNLTYKALKQHFDWNKKNCPRILRDTGRWEWFVDEVRKEMEVNTMLDKFVEKYTAEVVEKGLDILFSSVSDDGLPSKWAEDEFNEAKKLGITDGTNPKMFATREEVAIMVKRAVKKLQSPAENAQK